uniref:TauD/TfdA-like domain-containing protein n=1 Tax=Octactis speculum TaxID=3111310 RepID=A0A7S2C8S4_9STRA|mmetsp:Transcript_32831/g.44472  ORF Transcript_32831/g.44472 Transcript_32831/m.44472 type:complete len:424 (+) Transcript_32831:56-1327(+)
MPSFQRAIALFLAISPSYAFLGVLPSPQKSLVTCSATATLPGPLAEAPDVGDLPLCPATKWNSDFEDVVAERGTDPLPACPLEWTAEDAAEGGVEYFASKKAEIMQSLQDHGCIWFKNFDLMKDTEGFRAFYDALELDLCLDPIHTSGLRKMTSPKDGIYEEVNKASLAGHYIGLHQESTHVKTAVYGAFVCFKKAPKGGEFLVADAARILRDMDPEVLRRINEKKVRISVSNLDFDFLNAVGPLREKSMDTMEDLLTKTVVPKFDMELEMLWGSDGNPMRLQAVEPPMSPVNRHPKTGMPLWFCNIHNHARYLRDNRPCTVPEVGMTDVYYGDLSPIPKEDLEHIDEVSRKHIVRVPMEPGDVIFVDNYRMLHGRDIFTGDRFHAVAWFGERSEEDRNRAASQKKEGNFLNAALNNYVENAF